MHQDHLGSGRKMTDSSGVVQYRGEFDPYGQMLLSWSGTGYDKLNSKRFGSKERDNESGLDFMQARYYGSLQGRFTSVDPFDPILGKQGADDAEAAEKELRSYLRQPQHWNRYVYALNNPLKYVDPDGMDPITVNLNIIYDQNSNYTDEEKRRIRESYVAQAQKNFGKIDGKFNVTETTGVANNISDERKQAVVSGAGEGAINAFFTKAGVGPSSETAHNSTGTIFISTGAQGADPRDLTHGIIHAVGIAGGVNGYRGPTKFLGSYALGGLTDYGPGSAEYHTEAIQQYLEGRRQPIYTYGYNSAKTGAPPTITPTTTHTTKDMQVLKDGFKRYSSK
jgi:RHS repeat-associated protein